MFHLCFVLFCFFFFQAEDGIRDAQESRGLGDVYKRQSIACVDSYLDRFGFEPEVILFELAAGVGLVTE